MMLKRLLASLAVTGALVAGTTALAAPANADVKVDADAKVDARVAEVIVRHGFIVDAIGFVV